MIDQFTAEEDIRLFKEEGLSQIDRALLIVNQSLSLSTKRKRVETFFDIEDAIKPAFKMLPSAVSLSYSPSSMPRIKGVLELATFLFCFQEGFYYTKTRRVA